MDPFYNLPFYVLLSIFKSVPDLPLAFASHPRFSSSLYTIPALRIGDIPCHCACVNPIPDSTVIIYNCLYPL